MIILYAIGYWVGIGLLVQLLMVYVWCRGTKHYIDTLKYMDGETVGEIINLVGEVGLMKNMYLASLLIGPFMVPMSFLFICRLYSK